MSGRDIMSGGDIMSGEGHHVRWGHHGCPITCIVIVDLVHPEGNGEQLEHVEWVEHFLHKEDIVRLHRNINGVRTIGVQPVVRDGEED